MTIRPFVLSILGGAFSGLVRELMDYRAARKVDKTATLDWSLVLTSVLIGAGCGVGVAVGDAGISAT